MDLHNTAGRRGRRPEGEADARVYSPADLFSAGQGNVLLWGCVGGICREKAWDCSEVVSDAGRGHAAEERDEPDHLRGG